MMKTIDWNKHIAAIWRARQEQFKAVHDVDLMQLERLLGIERQDEYFAIVDMLFEKNEVSDINQLHVLADRFARERGSRNGRIAQQFFNQWRT